MTPECNPKPNSVASFIRRGVQTFQTRWGRGVNYEEVFTEQTSGSGKDKRPTVVKTVLKNGLIISEIDVTSPLPIPPKRFVPLRYTPRFAVGRCIDISGGDMKVIYVDQEGQGDSVIKRFKYNTYWGDYAQERAETAAQKFRDIYGVIEEICPQNFLPTEVRVAEMPDSKPNLRGWAVYEIQQRAIFVSPFLCLEPQAAERITQEARKLAPKYNQRIIKQLLKRRICGESRYKRGMISDLYEMHFELRWDCITHSLVGGDIIDYVNIPNPRFNLRKGSI